MFVGCAILTCVVIYGTVERSVPSGGYIVDFIEMEGNSGYYKDSENRVPRGAP